MHTKNVIVFSRKLFHNGYYLKTIKQVNMLFDNVRNAWKKRAARELIKKAGLGDWCTFAKALCGSSDCCHGFPYLCKSCFDAYFSRIDVIQNCLEQ
jgi:hypothetical protein